MRSRSLTSAVARLLALAAIALMCSMLAPAGWVGGPGSAEAHAVVVSSRPGDRERLPQAPPEVSITFSERVTSVGPGLTVVDGTGASVDRRDARVLADGTTVSVGLRPGLGDGTYFASYRVISADGHAINGAVVFAVGTGGLVDGTSPVATSADGALAVAQAAARFATYAGALLAAGMALFLAFVHDGGPERARLAAWLRVACVVGALGAVATVATQAALATGGGLRAAVDPEVLRQVLTDGLGWTSVVLLVGLAAVHLSADVAPGTTSQTLGFYGALAAAGSFALWGHATEAPRPTVALVADVVHLVAAAVWFGGLVGVAVVLRGRRLRTAPSVEPTNVPAAVGGHPAAPPEPDTGPLADVGRAEAGDGAPAGPRYGAAPGSDAATVGIVSRFSGLAAASVGALAVAGIVLSWQMLGSFGALATSTYGRVLVLKLGLVGVVLALAAYNRFRLVPRLRAAGPDAPVVARLATSTRREALVLLAALAVTAVLVNVTPGRIDDSGVTAGPFNQTLPGTGGQYQVNLVVSPAQAGTNRLHLTVLDAAGAPVASARSATADLAMPAQGIGPINRELTPAGPGHFIAEDNPDLGVAGTWSVSVAVRLSTFDETRAEFSVPVAAAGTP